ncbi:MAG: VCBS repeat-containing protein [Planctomycetaceae bacterium]
MFAFDIDGDGDNDVLTSLAAHGYGLTWYEHARNDAGGIEFTAHRILGDKPEDNPFGVCFSQLHAVDIADVNGDGLLDIITGKRWWAHGPHGDAEPNVEPVLYWFELTRGNNGAESVQWVPRLIDGGSGVGTQVMAVDINGDEAVDIVVGNKRGTFVSVQSKTEVTAAELDRHNPRSDRQKARARRATACRHTMVCSPKRPPRQ